MTQKAETNIVVSGEQVTAVVLAGGLGTRLRTVVADRPKVLAQVSGRPFIEYILDQVISAEVKQAVLCVGYLAEQIEEQLGSKYKALQLSYSREKALLGTAGALRFALQQVKTEYLMVMNGDSYCECDFSEFLRFHFSMQSRASMLLTKVGDTRRYGRVLVGERGEISAFEEKGINDGEGWINAGTYLIHRDLIKEIPLGRTISLEREIFPNWIGKSFFGFCMPQGKFIDIGTPQSYEQAQDMFEGEAKDNSALIEG
ncbi:MAG: nucleotidyltransferase family protein [Oligoflexia bacterium]|nr:nucleotidyltransferase family protein [Oligoflexia bacterium]